MKTFHSIQEIKDCVKYGKSPFWFSPATMKAFKTRVRDYVYRGCYFITSDAIGNTDRAFSIRMVTEDGSVETIYRYKSFTSVRQAEKAIKALPEGFPDAVKFAADVFNNGQGKTPVLDRMFVNDDLGLALKYLIENYEELGFPFAGYFTVAA